MLLHQIIPVQQVEAGVGMLHRRDVLVEKDGPLLLQILEVLAHDKLVGLSIQLEGENFVISFIAAEGDRRRFVRNGLTAESFLANDSPSFDLFERCLAVVACQLQLVRGRCLPLEKKDLAKED